MKNEARITYFGQPAKVICDRKCNKAFGIQTRPRVQLSTDPDDFAWLADGELGEAPPDPGTYEGMSMEAKPLSPDHFPNKWCVRECERSVMSKPGEYNQPLDLPDFSKRINNIKTDRPQET